MTTTIAKRQNGNPAVSFGNVVDNIFQNSLRHFFDDNFWDTERYLTSGNVPVNVREKEHQYEMDVIAPGCRKEDFNINISNNMLTVSFEQKQQHTNQPDDTWVRNEYLQRSFARSFTLDDSVDAGKISATYTDGILRVILPKNEKAKQLSKQIEIS
jgi:HSP20 family protein